MSKQVVDRLDFLSGYYSNTSIVFNVLNANITPNGKSSGSITFNIAAAFSIYIKLLDKTEYLIGKGSEDIHLPPIGQTFQVTIPFSLDTYVSGAAYQSLVKNGQALLRIESLIIKCDGLCQYRSNGYVGDTYAVNCIPLVIYHDVSKDTAAAPSQTKPAPQTTTNAKTAVPPQTKPTPQTAANVQTAISPQTVATPPRESQPLVLLHPEEPVNPSAMLANTDVVAIITQWLTGWGVPAQHWNHWKKAIEIQVYETYPASIVAMGISQDIPAATWESGGKRFLVVKPRWLNPGVIAHEQAHNSYSYLNPILIKDFAALYASLKNTDPFIKLLYSINKYGLTSDVEGRAEVYRYLGQNMPEQLKQFYPLLF